jgi:hypothetical protein
MSKRIIPLWLWAAIVVALLFALFNDYEARFLREKIQQTQISLDQQVQLQKETALQLALARREALILADARSLQIVMVARRDGFPDLHATWHPALGIIVSGRGLPAPAVDRALQLWLIPKTAGAKPIPVLAVRPDAGGKFHMLVQNPPDSQRDSKALTITDEPAGGSSQPTVTPIWVGVVRGN